MPLQTQDFDRIAGFLQDEITRGDREDALESLGILVAELKELLDVHGALTRAHRKLLTEATYTVDLLENLDGVADGCEIVSPSEFSEYTGLRDLVRSAQATA